MGRNIENKRQFQREWLKKRKKEDLEKLGPCLFCGSVENIEIHHIDPDKKISHGIWSWSEKRKNDELKKCVSLCNRCHRLFHALVRKIPVEHGNTMYKWGCRCEECKKDHSRVNATYK